MKILLSGFDAFGGLETNPSQIIVETIERRWKPRPGAYLTTEVLPTEYAAAEDRIRKLVREIRPDAILSLGLAESLSYFSLERIAVNLDDEIVPDNAGEIRRGQRIVPDGPALYRSTLPLERIRNVLHGSGMPVRYSDDAGTYVCNHVFYAALDQIKLSDLNAQCGLIHVPSALEPLKRSNRVGNGLPLEVMVPSIEGCIEAILNVPLS